MRNYACVQMEQCLGFYVNYIESYHTLNRMGLSYVSWVNFSPKIAVDIYAGAELHGGPGGPWTTMRSAHTRPIVDI